MRLKNEAEILDPKVRLALLKEMRDTENTKRKAEALRRYEIYKDQTKKYVLDALAAEGLKPSTLLAMSNRTANISICKKIVNKKARAYSGGVRREAGEATVTAQIDELTRLLHFDKKMRKGDRYRELHKNCLLGVIPELDVEESSEGKPRYRLQFVVKAPWQYDVVEDFYDREKPMAIIFGDFDRGVSTPVSSTSTEAGYHRKATSAPGGGDGIDQGIADADSKLGAFIWWTKNYHFVTDERGVIIPTPGNEANANPIGFLPFANNSEDQDGKFWAIGGDDVVDGAILVNKMLTDMNYIAYLQGFGQMVITGTNIKDSKFQVGPANAMILEYDASKEEAAPTVEIISATPPLEAWMRMVEQYVALLLTTNNLSPGNVSGQLSAATFPSGIAMLVEQSESTDDVTTKQADYVSKERHLLEAARLWHNLYFGSDQLCADFKQVGKLPDSIALSIRYVDAKPAISEGERLANIKARKDLGINEQVDLIMIDNPDMTREEAEQKLLKILAEKINAGASALLEDDAAGEGADSETTQPGAGDEEASAPAAVEGADIQSQVLNGAQVSSLIEIVVQVANGTLPRDSAVEAIMLAYQIDRANADKILGSAGKGFTPAAAPAAGGGAA